jgi:hypothetical protein
VSRDACARAGAGVPKSLGIPPITPENRSGSSKTDRDSTLQKALGKPTAPLRSIKYPALMARLGAGLFEIMFVLFILHLESHYKAIDSEYKIFFKLFAVD